MAISYNLSAVLLAVTFINGCTSEPTKMTANEKAAKNIRIESYEQDAQEQRELGNGQMAMHYEEMADLERGKDKNESLFGILLDIILP